MCDEAGICHAVWSSDYSIGGGVVQNKQLVGRIGAMASKRIQIRRKLNKNVIIEVNLFCLVEIIYLGSR